MSTKYKATIAEKAYFITITTVYWVDIFTRLNHRYTFINSLKYCQQHKNLNVFAYCIMPSHVHLICSTNNNVVLADVIRDLKKFTSKQIVENIKNEPESRREWLLELFEKACAHLKRKQEYKVWQDGYHAEILESENFIHQKLNYIHQNPVVDGIVEKPENYLFSSARNYADLDNLLEVHVLPPQLKTF